MDADAAASAVGEAAHSSRDSTPEIEGGELFGSLVLTDEEGMPATVRQPEGAYQQHRGSVMGALARRCPWVSPADRESLFHDAYTALLERERAGKLDPERMHPRELRAYLVTSAIHKALDERKSAERQRTVPLDLQAHDRGDGSEPLEERAVGALDAAAIRSSSPSCPQRRQAVLKLRFYLGLEPAEIQSLLAISGRAYRKELERAVRQVAGRYELVRTGRWCEERRSLVLAYVAGVAGPRRTEQARAHLKGCPGCARMAAELRESAERAAAVAAAPDVILADGPLERATHAVMAARDGLAGLVSGSKQQAGGLAGKVTDPTPLAGARPGAAVAAIAGCLAVGGGATYCAVEGVPDVFRGPLGIERTTQADKRPGKQRGQDERRARAGQAPTPVVTLEPPAPTEPVAKPEPPPPAPEPEPVAPAPAPEPPPPTPAQQADQEFGFEQTAPSRDFAAPTQPATGAGTGAAAGNEFAP